MKKMIFPQSITLEKLISRDVWGAGTYDTPRTVPAAVDYIIKNIIDTKGNQITTSAWIALPPGTEVDLRDRITLRDGSTPFIGSIAPAINYRTGKTHYIEVYVARQRPGEA